MDSLQVVFGAGAAPLADQLAASGLTADAVTLFHLQADADAVLRLASRGVLPRSAVVAARLHIANKLTRQAWRVAGASPVNAKEKSK